MPKGIHFFITDHSADRSETGETRLLRKLYAGIKADGISLVRYDWRWSLIEPKQDHTDHYALMRYMDAITVMLESGLQLPTIILSSVPSWALELYKEDKSKFFLAYERFVQTVTQALRVWHERSGSKQKIHTVQVLNELNNRVYTPISPQDVIQLCWTTRRALAPYSIDIKLVGSLVVGNLARVIGMDVREYLRLYAHVIREFDVISLDCYPGVWHLPFLEAWRGKKSVFGCLGLLHEVIERLSLMGKVIELDEVGLPTNAPLIGVRRNEVRQRYFFAVFFRAFKRLLLDLEKRGFALPVAVGIYEAVDEPPRTRTAKWIYLLSGGLFPEHDFGLRRADGSPKLVLRGNRRTGKGPPQMQNLLRYINAPLRRAQ